ncbi:MAG: PQQ-binding-like beta-propeller repeat protein [Candidatus Polarisedimenticolia bacterium]
MSNSTRAGMGLLVFVVVAAAVALDIRADQLRGFLRWEDALFPGNTDSSYQDLVVANGTLFAVGVGPLRNSPSTHADIHVRAYEPGSGEILWTHRRVNVFEDESSAGIAGAGNTVVVAGTSDPIMAVPRFHYIFVLALDARTGERLWEDRCGTNTLTQARSIASLGDRVFVSGDCDGLGFLRAYDAASGAVLWEQREEFNSLVVADSDRVYTAGFNPVGAIILRSLDAATGAQNWFRPVFGTPFDPGVVLHSLVAHGDLVSLSVTGVSGGHRIETFDAEMGTSRWQDEPGGPAEVLTLHGPFLYAGSAGSGFHVRAYDAGTGERVWERAGSGEVGGIEPIGRSVVVSDDNGGFHVEGLDARSGLLLWEDLFVAPRGGAARPTARHGGKVFVGGFRGAIVPPFLRTECFLRAYDNHGHLPGGPAPASGAPIVVDPEEPADLPLEPQ